MQNRILLIVLAIVIIGIVLAGIFLWEKPWQSHSNVEWGVEFSYPPNWVINEEYSDSSSLAIQDEKSGELCYLTFGPMGLLNEAGSPVNSQEFADSMFDLAAEASDNVALLEESDINISGYDSVRVLLDEGIGVSESVYTVGKKYGVSFWCFFEKREGRDAFKSDFDRIIESIKISSDLNSDNIE